MRSRADNLHRHILLVIFCLGATIAISQTYGEQPSSNYTATAEPQNGTSHEDPADQADSSKVTLPDWVKSIARLWLEGKISDEDFLAAIQQIVDQKILNPSSSTEQSKTPEGFSNTQCNRGHKHVEMTGKYTNGDTAYQIVALRVVLQDADGGIVATGAGIISNIGPHETRYFNAVIRYDSDFASCHVEVENVLLKN
jgi:hypothetical protein